MRENEEKMALNSKEVWGPLLMDLRGSITEDWDLDGLDARYQSSKNKSSL